MSGQDLDLLIRQEEDEEMESSQPQAGQAEPAQPEVMAEDLLSSDSEDDNTECEETLRVQDVLEDGFIIYKTAQMILTILMQLSGSTKIPSTTRRLSKKLFRIIDQVWPSRNARNTITSFKAFLKGIRGHTSFTTFSELLMAIPPEEFKTSFLEWKPATTKATCSSSANTKSTSMSCMTATGRANAVSAPESSRFESIEDILLGKCSPSKRSTQSIGQIFQSTSVRARGSVYIRSSTVPFKDEQYIAQVKIFRSRDVQDMDVKNWWKVALARGTFAYSKGSKVDQVLSQSTVLGIDLIQKGQNYEEREIPSSFEIDRFKIEPYMKYFNFFFVHKSVKEIYEYTVSTEYRYAAPTVDIYDYYYTLDESMDVLVKLLEFQFGDIDVIKEFLLDLYNVLERKRPKLNCMVVISPPSAGKNFFFDCVLNFFFNWGQIGNFNRYSQFPLQECINRRVLYWNEPNYEPCSLETLKMLLGGDVCPAKIKYQGDRMIQRTPVIVTSNSEVFPDNEAFESRIRKYHWNAAPFLFDYKKKPLPLVTYHLFEKYNIM